MNRNEWDKCTHSGGHNHRWTEWKEGDVGNSNSHCSRMVTTGGMNCEQALSALVAWRPSCVGVKKCKWTFNVCFHHWTLCWEQIQSWELLFHSTTEEERTDGNLKNWAGAGHFRHLVNTHWWMLNRDFLLTCAALLTWRGGRKCLISAEDVRRKWSPWDLQHERLFTLTRVTSLTYPGSY